MALTDAALRALKPAEKTKKVSDAQGLFVQVEPNGSRLWRYGYRHQGKQKLLALGAYPEISLSTARAARDAARAQLRDGIDPAVQRKLDLDLAALAEVLPVLPAFADIDRIELLREVARLIAGRARLREKFHKDHNNPSELEAALDQTINATKRLIARLSGMDSFARTMDAPSEVFAEVVMSLSKERQLAGIKFLVGASAQSKQLAEIAAAAQILHDLVADHLKQTAVPKPDVRSDILRQEFLKNAVDAWAFLTNKPAGKSKDGPFIRFAAGLWLEGDMPIIEEHELAARLGQTFQRMKI